MELVDEVHHGTSIDAGFDAAFGANRGEAVKQLHECATAAAGTIELLRTADVAVTALEGDAGVDRGEEVTSFLSVAYRRALTERKVALERLVQLLQMLVQHICWIVLAAPRPTALSLSSRSMRLLACGTGRCHR